MREGPQGLERSRTWPLHLSECRLPNLESCFLGREKNRFLSLAYPSALSSWASHGLWGIML